MPCSNSRSNENATSCGGRWRYRSDIETIYPCKTQTTIGVLKSALENKNKICGN